MDRTIRLLAAFKISLHMKNLPVYFRLSILNKPFDRICSDNFRELLGHLLHIPTNYKQSGHLSSQLVRNKKQVGSRSALSHSPLCGAPWDAPWIFVISSWMMSSTKLHPTLNFQPCKKPPKPQCQLLPELLPEPVRPRRDILQALVNKVFVFLRGSEPEFHVCDQSDQESSSLGDSLVQ